MKKWSFDDNAIGHVGDDGQSLSAHRPIKRPKDMSTRSWHDIARQVCFALDDAEERSLVPVIARVASDNVHLRLRVQTLLGANNLLVENNRKLKRQSNADS